MTEISIQLQENNTSLKLLHDGNPLLDHVGNMVHHNALSQQSLLSKLLIRDVRLGFSHAVKKMENSLLLSSQSLKLKLLLLFLAPNQQREFVDTLGNPVQLFVELA